MSEPAPERVAPPSRAGGGGGNVFTNKIGPLPMWAWVGIAAGILVVWRFYSAKNSASASSQATPATTAADQVPQFVNQTYTTVTAPSVPSASTGTTTTGSGTDTGTGNTAGGYGFGSSGTWGTFLAASGAPAPTPTAAPPSPTAPQQLAKVASTLASVTGLRTTGAGATNVGLAWNPVSGAQQYQVRVTYQGKVVKTAMTNGTSYNVTGLSPNRTYGLHVVAINGSNWAPETSVTQKTT